MADQTHDIVCVDLDEDGFLKSPDNWSETLALFLARNDGVRELSERHWAIIFSLRDYFYRYGTPPASLNVCHVNRLEGGCLTDLFNNGYKEAWRIAGLPNPGEEAKAYM